MLLAAVFVLSVIDSAVILYVFFRQKTSVKSDLLLEMQEERALVEEMEKKITFMLQEFQGLHRKAFSEMQKIAGEVEQESKSFKGLLQSSLQDATKDVREMVKNSVQDLSVYRGQLEVLLRKAEKEKMTFFAASQRLENVLAMLQKEMPYEDIVTKVNHEKMDEVRFLLAQGHYAEDIARELNLPLQDVKLMAFAHSP